MEILTQPVMLIGLAFLLAMVVERLLEIVKSIIDYFDTRSNAAQIWTRRAESIRNRLELRLNNAKNGDRQQFSLIMEVAARYLSPESSGRNGPLVVSADRVREMSVKLRCKIVGLGFGLLFAWVFKLDIIRLTELAMQTLVDVQSYSVGPLGIILTGVAMGLGAGPVHAMISALEKARETRRKAAKEA